MADKYTYLIGFVGGVVKEENNTLKEQLLYPKGARY